MTRLLQRALLMTIALMAALLAAEGVIRWLGLAPLTIALDIDTPTGSFVRVDDPDLKYIPKAGARDINSYGLRDRTYALAKPAGTFRIVVIGDSVTFGMCNQSSLIPLEQTFVKRMESALDAAPHPGVDRVEVIDLGVPGYDTLNEAAFFKMKGAALSPDLVIIAYVLNDNYEASAELMRFRSDPRWYEPSGISRVLFNHSHLVRLVWQRLSAFEYRRPDWKHDTVEEVPRSDHVQRGFAAIEALARSQHFQVLTAVFPVFYGNNWRGRPDIFDNYPRAAEHAIPRSEAARHGFLFVDLLDDFRRAAHGDARTLQGSCDAEHPNAAGHAVAADALVRFIEAHDLIAAGHPSPAVTSTSR